ncbi:MAG: hypothetical protein C5B58_12050 [Acidobacteria bacterium]|nr:MAG: hypothetical protein C5B58_12050 [Acidobacteriota bacterium]
MAGRRLWIGYQCPVLRSNCFLSVDETRLLRGAGMCAMRLAEGSKPEDVHFGESGYARSTADAQRAGQGSILSPGPSSRAKQPTTSPTVMSSVSPSVAHGSSICCSSWR